MKKALRLLGKLVAIAFVGIYLYPIYILINVAVKTREELAASPYSFPTGIAWSNFTEAARQADYFTLLTNSFVLTVITVTFLIIFSAMASYGISRGTGRYLKFMYVFFLAGLMIPLQMIMLPLYRVISRIGLMNNMAALVVIYLGAGMPFLIFYFVGFLKTIPKELDESAKIDGASKQRIFWSIIFPLMRTSVLTVTVLQVIWIWNDFLIPLLFLKAIKNDIDGWYLQLCRRERFGLDNDVCAHHYINYSSYFTLCIPAKVYR